MNIALLAARATVLADGAPRNHGPDFGKASPIGLLVIVLLLIATLLLIRSMNRQLKKLPGSFGSEHPAPGEAPGPAPGEPPGEAPGQAPGESPGESPGPGAGTVDPQAGEGNDGATRTTGPGDEPR